MCSKSHTDELKVNIDYEDWARHSPVQSGLLFVFLLLRGSAGTCTAREKHGDGVFARSFLTFYFS